jgi:hypothetical protein
LSTEIFILAPGFRTIYHSSATFDPPKWLLWYFFCEHVFVTRQAPIPLRPKASNREVAARIAQVCGDEIAQSQSFIQLSYQDETAIGGDP